MLPVSGFEKFCCVTDLRKWMPVFISIICKFIMKVFRSGSSLRWLNTVRFHNLSLGKKHIGARCWLRWFSRTLDSLGFFEVVFFVDSVAAAASCHCTFELGRDDTHSWWLTCAISLRWEREKKMCPAAAVPALRQIAASFSDARWLTYIQRHHQRHLLLVTCSVIFQLQNECVALIKFMIK